VSGIATEVSTENGIVTLKGEADNQAQKDMATEYAKDIDGVKGVNNAMTISKTAKKSRRPVQKSMTRLLPHRLRWRFYITVRPVASKRRLRRTGVWSL
jgi:hypothetical protein